MAHAAPRAFAPGVQPWERQPTEPDDAWTAFLHFRDAEDDEHERIRSLNETSRTRKEHATTIKRWAKRWRWQDRVVAFDRHLDAVALRVKERALREMTKAHASLANAALGVLQEPVRELIRRIESNELKLDPQNVSHVELIKIVRQSASAIKDLVAVERVARGVPETVVGGIFGAGAGQLGAGTFAAMVAQIFEGGGAEPVNPLAALLANPPPKPEPATSTAPAPPA